MRIEWASLNQSILSLACNIRDDGIGIFSTDIFPFTSFRFNNNHISITLLLYAFPNNFNIFSLVPLGILISCNELQSPKAQYPMHVTLSGIVIKVREEHPQKA